MDRRIFSTGPILVAMLGALMSACAHTAMPPELASARHAYEHAIAGQAPALAPKELEAAHKALSLAEVAHSEEVGGPVGQTLGYIAERRAEQAEAIAGAIAADKQRAQAEAEVEAGIAVLRERMAVRQKADEARQAQEEAGRKADTALEGLGRFATVSRASRGTVINVPGSALFTDGEPRVSKKGLERLAEIADAIRLEPDKKIVVQGYADTHGRGRDLARHRAQAVRDELVTRGIPADRVRAETATDRIEAGVPTEPRSIDIVLEPPTK